MIFIITIVIGLAQGQSLTHNQNGCAAVLVIEFKVTSITGNTNYRFFPRSPGPEGNECENICFPPHRHNTSFLPTLRLTTLRW